MREGDLQLLITLDDPWNAQECDIFNNGQAEHSVAHGRGQPDTTSGRHDHRVGDVIDNVSYKAAANTTAG